MTNNSSVPSMPIAKVIKELAVLYSFLINGNKPYDMVPAPFLWGPPGVGKSDGVKELAGMIEKSTGKKVMVTDIRLLLFSPIDLRGVPVADKSRTFTDWLKPRILDMDPSEDVVNILFLDELSAAPQSVQAAAYQLTLNRAIGEHKLPSNTIVMAAGNRTTDRAVAYKMPSALANRMMHFDIRVDYMSWSQWAITEGNVHPLVLGYLSFDMSKLYLEDKSLDDMAFPTPRSWMFVSNILHTLGKDEDVRNYKALIASCIGMGTTVEFLGWCKVYKTLPKVEDIFAGKEVKHPSSPDALYALVAAMTTYAVKLLQFTPGGLTLEEMENVSRFCSTIPADYAFCFYRNVISVVNIRSLLMKSSHFIAWGKKHKGLLDEIENAA